MKAPLNAAPIRNVPSSRHLAAHKARLVAGMAINLGGIGVVLSDLFRLVAHHA